MKYDDASWHYGGDFPTDLPPEAGATHIGMFLAWAIGRGLIAEFHREESIDALEKVRSRQMSGAQFLLQECDEKFTDEDLNEIGNAFAQKYYESEYLADYCAVFAEGGDTYRVADSWYNFDRLAPILDARFEEWRVRQRV